MLPSGSGALSQNNGDNVHLEFSITNLERPRLTIKIAHLSSPTSNSGFRPEPERSWATKWELELKYL